jgi:hypothetical protein
MSVTISYDWGGRIRIWQARKSVVVDGGIVLAGELNLSMVKKVDVFGPSSLRVGLVGGTVHWSFKGWVQRDIFGCGRDFC